ncbi:zf-HC2 domain-containing protein [Xylanimonas oleitrophica]|uniref:Zf-HC2 domain-containing protein n=2 Tax=Xylanimonas oleitrophica TaxID=2607479 RepID=A0A2W5WV05_9MICO|nr:zf-HC2 domain-containing protein [Xylanimonas oleitrophica]
MSSTPRDPLMLDAAAYVLGALPAAEHKRFEQHTEVCRSCQHAVCELSAVTDLLRLAPREAIMAWLAERPAGSEP